MRFRIGLVMPVLILVGVALGSLHNRPTVAQQQGAPAPVARPEIGQFEMRLLQATNPTTAMVVVTDTSTGRTWLHEMHHARKKWIDLSTPPDQ
jgi:hypothetical protein